MSGTAHAPKPHLLLIASFTTKLPEAGSKDECHSNGEGESGGVVVRCAPVGDVELPEADTVLLKEAACVNSIKLEGSCASFWLTALLNDLLCAPVEALQGFSFQSAYKLG